MAVSSKTPDEAEYGYTMEEITDWDENGNRDLLLTGVRGEHFFYKNGEASTKTELNSGKVLPVAWPTAPQHPN